MNENGKKRKRKRRSLWFLIWLPLAPVIDFFIMRWSIGIDLQQQPPEGMIGHPAPAFIMVGMALSFLVICVVLVYVAIRMVIFIILTSRDRKAELREQEMNRQMLNSDVNKGEETWKRE